MNVAASCPNERERWARRLLVPALRADAAVARAPALARRSLSLCVCGAPNAGKSSLVNRLAGAHVSIATPKAHTTRAPLRVIATRNAVQLVMTDSAGVLRRKTGRGGVGRAFLQDSRHALESCDAVLLVVDARVGVCPSTLEFLRFFEGGAWQGGVAVALNKIDIVPRASLPPLAKALAGLFAFDAFFMLSALNGDGIVRLARWLESRARPGAWRYPARRLTDASLRRLAADATREKLFLRMRDEVPYGLYVATRSCVRQGDGSWRIEQEVVVDKTNHRAIVLGKGGRRLKGVGIESRRHMQALLGCRVHLFLQLRAASGGRAHPYFGRSYHAEETIF